MLEHAFPLIGDDQRINTPAYWISSLRLTNFRNHENLLLEPQKQSVALVGENGTGKTNILEALSFLMPGRGLRGSSLNALTHAENTGGWSVRACIERPNESYGIGTGQPAGADPLRRAARVDSNALASLNDLAKFCRMVWMTPAMDGLFMAAAAERRKFLDRLVLVLDTEHKRRTNSFETAIRQRNNLLEQDKYDPTWLDAIETQIAEHGVAIAASRCETVMALQDMMTSRRTNIIFPFSRIRLDGVIENELATIPAIDVEDRYRTQLAENRLLDARVGRTLVGPHRSDMIVHHVGKERDARDCSTGEQKKLLIGIVLAHAQMIAAQEGGTAPILLLDEIAAHLDKKRRDALFDELMEIGVQAWMTGADENIFTESGAQIYQIMEGKVNRIK